MLTIPPATPPAPAQARARRRRAVPLAVTAVATVTLAGLLAACASTTSHQASSTPTASGRTQTPAAAKSASSPGGRSASPGTAGLAVCQSASLRVTVNASQAGGAAGSTYYPVDFTNTSGSPCQMYGYPGMSFVTAEGSVGRQIGAAAQQNPAFGKLAVRRSRRPAITLRRPASR